MKSFFVLSIIFILSCSCFKEEPLPPKPPYFVKESLPPNQNLTENEEDNGFDFPPIQYPNKDLQEIMFSATYSLENKEKRKELERCLKLDDQNYHNTGGNDCMYRLNEGETIEEALKGRLSYVGKESFHLHKSHSYCYDKIENTYPINKNFIARLYDENFNFLDVEVFASQMQKFDETYKRFYLSFYIPYHNKARFIRIFKIEGKEERHVSEWFVFADKKGLQKVSVPDTPEFEGFGVMSELTYNEEYRCHHIPFSH